MPATTSNQFQMLRARIENSLSLPLSLLVSSATDRDGKSVCAQGLAESLAAAGHKTLLVDVDHHNPRLAGLPRLASIALDGNLGDIDRAMRVDSASKVTMLSLADESIAASASKDSLARVMAHLRSRFDAIVVEAAKLVDSSIGLLFAGECNAVILTALEGRSVCANDRATLVALDREGANFFGVVTVGGRTINEFRQRSIQPAVAYAPPPLVAKTQTEQPMARSLG